MRVITYELMQKINQLAKGNKELTDLLAKSGEKTVGILTYNNQAYNNAKYNIVERVKEAMSQYDAGLDFIEIKDQLDDDGVIAQEIANELIDKSNHELFEMTLSEEFNDVIIPDYVETKEGIRVATRSYIDESLRDDIEEMAESLWVEVQEL